MMCGGAAGLPRLARTVPRGDPARGTAHDFNDAAGAVVGGHAADVDADFHDRGGGVLDHRAIARAAIGVRQVVVDGLGHADHAHFVAALDGFLVDLVGGVLGIVAADVKEIADVVRLEDLERAGPCPWRPSPASS